MNGEAGSAPVRDHSSGAAWLFLLVWATSLVTIIFEFVERLGFNPTDDGFVLAQTYRILHGQIPHRDFISPRPVGSPLLHTIDFTIPLPLLEATRLIGLVEIVAYTVLFALFVFDRPVRSWRGWQYGVVTIAVFVNVHVFPVMGWPTIDGLLFIAAGLMLLRTGTRRPFRGATYSGLALFGLSAVMKQSFYPVPLLGFVWATYLWSGRRRGEESQVSVLLSFACSVAPLTIYGIAIASLGGWHQMMLQTTNLPPFDLHGMFFVITGVLSGTVFAALIVALAGFIYFSGLHPSSSSKTTRDTAIDVWIRIVATVSIAAVPLSQHFAGPDHGTWATQLFWALTFLLIADLVVERRVDWIGIAMFGVASTIMLSWGYPTPSLVGGSIMVWLFDRVWTGVRIERTSVQRYLAASTVVAVVVISLAAVHAGRTYPYYDKPATLLTDSLETVAPGLAGIRTNPTTAAYMTDISSCLARFPADSVAVLPDNPIIYPALHLVDPFPIDWMWPPEYRSSPERLVDAARALDTRGNYLVLFQPVDAFSLSTFSKSDLQRRVGTLPRFNDLLRTIDSMLDHGTHIRCGFFVGRYSRAAPRP